MPLDPRLFAQQEKKSAEPTKNFPELAREALAKDPNWLYGEVLPVAKNKQTGDYSAALPGFLRDYLSGWADLITGPSVGENLSPQAVLSILGPGAHAAAGSPSVVVGPGARLFNWAKAFRSPIGAADDIARNAIDDTPAMFQDADHFIGQNYKLSDVLHHPELFENYPELRDVDLSFFNGKTMLGSFSPLNNRIAISAANTSDSEMLGTMMHEIQHWIQHHEGMNFGSNPANFRPRDFAMLQNIVNTQHPRAFPPNAPQTSAINDLKREVYDIALRTHGNYERAPGEMEARAVQEAFMNNNETPQAVPNLSVDPTMPAGWGFAEPGPKYHNSELPFPYNFLDRPASEGRLYDPLMQQGYSPQLKIISDLLRESLAK